MNVKRKNYINSCDYVMDQENCIRDIYLEEKLKAFYEYIQNKKISKAVEIAKNNPKIL
jgi:hypothetical protein